MRLENMLDEMRRLNRQKAHEAAAIKDLIMEKGHIANAPGRTESGSGAQRVLRRALDGVRRDTALSVCCLRRQRSMEKPPNLVRVEGIRGDCQELNAGQQGLGGEGLGGLGPRRAQP